MRTPSFPNSEEDEGKTSQQIQHHSKYVPSKMTIQGLSTDTV